MCVFLRNNNDSNLCSIIVVRTYITIPMFCYYYKAIMNYTVRYYYCTYGIYLLIFQCYYNTITYWNFIIIERTIAELNLALLCWGQWSFSYLFFYYYFVRNALTVLYMFCLIVIASGMEGENCVYFCSPKLWMTRNQTGIYICIFTIITAPFFPVGICRLTCKLLIMFNWMNYYSNRVILFTKMFMLLKRT